MIRTRLRDATVFVLLLALGACAHSLTIDERARQLNRQAAALEPAVTPMLVELARELGGEMIKLEYRLKSHKSTIRKLTSLHREDPRRPIEQLTLDDTLRYTMRFEDEPPGHHVASIKQALARLEAKGHRVVLLKNYWPRGDNYSGVNTVLKHSSGLEWELQFHTARSIEINAHTRAWYEELREDATTVERKRELFDLMTRPWDDVPVPTDILVPKSLHEREDIRERPRP